MRQSVRALPFIFTLKGILGLLLWASCEPAEEEKELLYLRSLNNLKEACAFLISQQADDGAWRSEVHGILKEGQAYTPFVLETLLSLPDSICMLSEEVISPARSFMVSRLDSQGALGLSDPLILEYPNYATAYALKCLVKLNKPADTLHIKKVQHYLVQQQFDESRGVGPENPAYGAWGFGETKLSPGFTGHVDLSHTRKVLEALRASGWHGDSTYQKTQIFLSYAQKRPEDTRWQGKNDSFLPEKYYDGGFYYSPVIGGTNKAGTWENTKDKPIYRSYATASSEGLLALLACGANREDREVVQVIRWMQGHAQFPYPAGISPEASGQWHRTLALYHMATWAEAAQAIQLEGPWPEEILENLESFRSERGSYLNPEGARNKENDPILGSCLAIKALWGSIQQWQSKNHL